MSLPINQVVVGDCTEIMRGWPADSIDLIVTSPPYWGLRDYGKETVRVWGDVPECEHEWFESESSSRERRHGEGSKTFFKDAWSPESAKRSQNVINKSTQTNPESDFCAKCSAWRGSLGLEPHPQMFIDHIVEICREIKRVLKPTGTFWLNLGDTYASMKGKAYNPGGGVTSLQQDAFKELTEDQNPNRMLRPDGGWLQPKQKLMIPSRVAIALQYEGWILRSDIIWHKPNAMPSSVKDRLTCVHEHLFFFVKKRRYYFDLDAIRVPHAASTIQRITQPNVMNQPGGDKQRELRGEGGGNASRSADMVKSLAKKLTKHDIAVGRIGNFSYTDPLHTKEYHPRGKNPGDLWRIPTKPFPGAHFATFPPKLIEPIVKAGSPRWVCSRCGKPRTRITGRPCTNCGEFIPTQGKECLSCGFRNTEWLDERKVNPVKRAGESTTVGPLVARRTDLTPHTISAGWSDCGCGEKWIPGIVMDPFGGSGTVGRVAHRLGRSFIIIEIKPEYTEMAHQRIRGKYKPLPEGAVTLDQFIEAEE